MTRAALLGLCLLALGCERVAHVRLRLSVPDGTPGGFKCTDSCGTPLLSRAFAGAPPSGNASAVARLSVRGDFIRLASQPLGSSPAQLVQYCTAAPGNCVATPGSCRDLELQVTGTELDRMGSLLAAKLEEAPLVITQDAPEGFVIFRVVVDSRPCAQVDETFLPTLIGCAFTSPLVLEQGGELNVGLGSPAAQNFCNFAVLRCASTFAQENFPRQCGP